MYGHDRIRSRTYSDFVPENRKEEWRVAFLLEVDVTYGELISTGLGNKGWTSEDLAEATGISRRTIDEWRQNRMNPSLENAVKVSDALSLPLEAFKRCTPAPPRPRSGDRKGK
jgi:DNA-binding XRE family transcriptional regulator